jgi:cytochrome P450
MLAARDPSTGEAMSDAQARDELVTMLVAGQETSAIALGWAVALLAHHPAAAKAAAAEVDAVLGSGSSARPPVPADVGRLPFTEAILLEALRLLPPAYIVGRCAQAGVDAFGPGARCTLPPGTTVLVSPWLLHRSPAAWAAPTQFWPERWLPLLGAPPPPGAAGPGGLRSGPALAGLGPNGAYAPFGAGPRVCIGAGFALMEGVLVLAAALSAFTFEPVNGGATFPSAAARITLRPESVRLRLRRRR